MVRRGVFTKSMKNRKIVLASASPRRKQLLEQVGIVPDEIRPANIDENINEDNPEKFVIELSRRKAEYIAKDFSDNEIIIAADTIVVLGSEILGKPENREHASEMLGKIAGRSHYVYTAVTLIFKNGAKKERKTFLEKTEVMLYPISEEDIREYVATGDADDKAGAYGIQGVFARFVKGICGDYNNVVGLPVGRVYRELQ